MHGERASARAAAASRRPLSPVTPNGTLVGQAPAGVPFVVCDVARSSTPACDRGPTGLQIHSDRGVSFTRSGTPECNARHSGRTRRRCGRDRHSGTGSCRRGRVRGKCRAHRPDRHPAAAVPALPQVRAPRVRACHRLLRRQDSNLDHRNQNPRCCRYTTADRPSSWHVPGTGLHGGTLAPRAAMSARFGRFAGSSRRVTVDDTVIA